MSIILGIVAQVYAGGYERLRPSHLMRSTDGYISYIDKKSDYENAQPIRVR